MSEQRNALSCAVFQARLPELIGSGNGVAGYSHLDNCENCRALLADLECIAETARRLFPIEDPPETLWDEIQLAIAEERISSHPR